MNDYSDEMEMERMFMQANNTKIVLVGISFDASVEDIDQQDIIIPENLQVNSTPYFFLS